ncbi:hypothetical protein ZOSMA_200G00250 [Zostera marina]|uniref:DUF4283 domain-containing protein n=1 Tax=Zostera marina TaxID=29655 RepID=A0A0K9PP55_ZOSMR|nr:hypothetical protein ZOSMA_200G00250 [Zostera marina]
MSFARGEDYLKCSDRVWDTLGDTVLMIRRESPEQICEKAYDWIPQWAYIKGLKPEMYAKSVVDSIVSVLGPSLLAEYTNTSRHPHCFRVSFQADPTSNYISTIPMIVNEGGGKESITTLKVTYDTIPSRCTRCRKFDHSSAQCPMENIPPPEKINPANIPQTIGKHILAEAEEEASMTPREIILIEEAHSAQNKVGYVAGRPSQVLVTTDQKSSHLTHDSPDTTAEATYKGYANPPTRGITCWKRNINSTPKFGIFCHQRKHTRDKYTNCNKYPDIQQMVHVI